MYLRTGSDLYIQNYSILDVLDMKVHSVTTDLLTSTLQKKQLRGKDFPQGEPQSSKENPNLLLPI